MTTNTAPKRARTEADKLNAVGISASRANLTLLEPEALTLITDPAHPLYDERVNIPVDPTEPLYRDIYARGVEKPIEVRKNGEDANGRPILQVVDGRQRVMILRHINAALPDGTPKRKLPVNFVHGDDAQMVLRGLSSNLLKRQETVLTKAIKAQKALALGCGLDEIAAACNLRTTKLLEDWMLVLNFVPEVKSAFNGELPASAIRTFARVPREEQLKVLEKIRGVGAKTQKQVAAATVAARTGAAYADPKTQPKTPSPKALRDLAGRIAKRISELRAEARNLTVTHGPVGEFDPPYAEQQVQRAQEIFEMTSRLEGARAAIFYVLGDFTLEASNFGLEDATEAAA